MYKFLKNIVVFSIYFSHLASYKEYYYLFFPLLEFDQTLFSIKLIYTILH